MSGQESAKGEMMSIKRKTKDSAGAWAVPSSALLPGVGRTEPIVHVGGVESKRPLLRGRSRAW